MNDETKCQSCGMTIDDGQYCEHCVDDQGNLQTFTERLERMSQWMQHESHAASPEDARQKALAYMATMPAWRDHPEVKAARRG